jgi:pantothenate synthetase
VELVLHLVVGEGGLALHGRNLVLTSQSSKLLILIAQVLEILSKASNVHRLLVERLLGGVRLGLREARLLDHLVH